MPGTAGSDGQAELPCPAVQVDHVDADRVMAEPDLARAGPRHGHAARQPAPPGRHGARPRWPWPVERIADSAGGGAPWPPMRATARRPDAARRGRGRAAGPGRSRAFRASDARVVDVLADEPREAPRRAGPAPRSARPSQKGPLAHASRAATAGSPHSRAAAWAPRAGNRSSSCRGRTARSAVRARSAPSAAGRPGPRRRDRRLAVLDAARGRRPDASLRGR